MMNHLWEKPFIIIYLLFQYVVSIGKYFQVKKIRNFVKVVCKF